MNMLTGEILKALQETFDATHAAIFALPRR
jgi:hypothetical protein